VPTRQLPRLEHLINKLIDAAIKDGGGKGYSGTVSEDYPGKWNTILRVVKLYEEKDGD
jgi:hypothetical protein